MKIAVWGAGEIGLGVAYRLVTTAFTSELHWINRTLHNIEYRVVDLEHGLDFAPTCRSVHAYSQVHAARALEGAGLLVITCGAAVEQGQKRADLYPKNRDLFSQAVIPALAGFEGVVLVVTNPVDLMARWLHKESRLPSKRVLGLGTVVETARLRASLSSYLSPIRPAREVWAYAVGTHDECFVPVALPGLGMGISMPQGESQEILDNARREVTVGAQRVKSDERSTLQPIVEGVVKVAESIASDRRSILTVSVLDPDLPEGLFYSVPCAVGRAGVVHRHLGVLSDPQVKAGIEVCVNRLRDSLRSAGEI